MAGKMRANGLRIFAIYGESPSISIASHGRLWLMETGIRPSRPIVPNYAKGKTSNKPPAVKAAVITRRAQGSNKSQIARDLKLGRPTVDSILAEANLDEIMSSGESLCAQLIPESVRVVKARLAKDSESAAFGILNPFILSKVAARSQGNPIQDAGLVTAIQMLVSPGATVNVNTAENKEDTAKAEESTPT